MKRVTIKDIAAEAGVSVCTVNKALYGKPKISEATRQRILAIVQKRGYQPNRLAQALVRKPLVIGVIHPSSWRRYYAPFIQGIREGWGQLRDHKIGLRFFAVSGAPEPTQLRQAIEGILAEKLSGVLVLRTFPSPAVREIWQRLEQKKLPFVFVGTEDPESPRLTSVRLDGRRCGQMAAELLGLLLGRNEPVAIIVERQDLLTFQEKIEGFAAGAAQWGLPVLGLYEVGPKMEGGNKIAKQLFTQAHHPRGVYVATENSVAFCRYLQKHPVHPPVKVIGTGIFPRLRAFMEQGLVQLSFNQNTTLQGRLALQALYYYLAEGKMPPSEILIQPSLLLRSNLDLADELLPEMYFKEPIR